MKKRLLAILQLGIGFGIIAFLIHGIDKGYQLVEFQIAPASIPAETVYSPGGAHAAEFMVLDPLAGGARLRTLSTAASERSLPAAGTLTRLRGQGPDAVAWTGRTVSRYGLALLAHSFAQAARHWWYLAAAVGSCFLCMVMCTLRWRTLLEAQGMRLPFRRVFTLYFIGHFFNVLMPGAVGGDLIKAYYVAGEAHHRRAEVVATVFIDRLVGLLALIMLASGVMAVRFRFFLQYPETRAALIFTAALLAGSIVGLVVVFRRNLFEQWAFFRRLEERTALGRTISRVYSAFHLCMNRRSVLLKTVGYSLLNHMILIGAAFFIGRSLAVAIPFRDYLTVFPIINSVAAIPITPGGLGTREFASKFLLGTVGVREVVAVPLSLLLYASLMSWSIVGAVVYIVYSQKRGRAPQVAEGDDGGGGEGAA